jgi:6-pyruvoyltetrahydropterin/6-carboxytetrahydropterin synthase
MLAKHKGLCNNIHGHTYKLIVTLKSDKLNDEGMLMDFKDLKMIMNKVVMDQYDHAFLTDTGTSSSLESTIATLLKDAGKRVVFLDYITTAENMAKGLYDELKVELPTLYKVRLYETPTSYAEYTGGA